MSYITVTSISCIFIMIITHVYSASREYLFLAGIWCSSKKPPTETFLSPLVEQLKLLATEGGYSNYSLWILCVLV